MQGFGSVGGCLGLGLEEEKSEKKNVKKMFQRVKYI